MNGTHSSSPVVSDNEFRRLTGLSAAEGSLRLLHRYLSCLRPNFTFPSPVFFACAHHSSESGLLTRNSIPCFTLAFGSRYRHSGVLTVLFCAPFDKTFPAKRATTPPSHSFVLSTLGGEGELEDALPANAKVPSEGDGQIDGHDEEPGQARS